jgi:hypothetical protein
MARIKGVPNERAGWLLRMARRFSRRRLGKDLELTSILGHSSWLLGGVGVFEAAMERATKLDPRVKSLAGIKAATLIGCPF